MALQLWCIGAERERKTLADGAIAVLRPNIPDVLSHVSVRAHTGKVSLHLYCRNKFLVRR